MWSWDLMTSSAILLNWENVKLDELRGSRREVEIEVFQDFRKIEEIQESHNEFNNINKRIPKRRLNFTKQLVILLHPRPIFKFQNIIYMGSGGRIIKIKKQFLSICFSKNLSFIFSKNKKRNLKTYCTFCALRQKLNPAFLFRLI